jgi:autotransporter-associated beta strand protein
LTVNARVSSNLTNIQKAGEGTLVLGANSQLGNTTGPTVVQQGVLRLAHKDALGTTTTGTVVQGGAALELSGGISDFAAEPLTINGTGISNGGALRNLSGSNSFAGAITIGSSGARINTDATTSLELMGGITTTVTQDVTFGGGGETVVSTTGISGSGGVNKDDSGTLTLSAASTYTGATTISGGTLVLAGATQATNSITFTGGSLGLDTGVTVAAANAAVNLTNGSIMVTGTTGNPSYTLLTAASITGTPVLAAPVSGYELQVVGGNELRLVQTGGGSPYETWATGNEPFDGDANGDGVDNGLAFLLGVATPGANATGLLPTTSQTGGNLVMSFTCLATADRGTATLTLEYDGDLAGTWLSVPVPGAVGAPNPIVENTTTGSVSFEATDGGTNANGDALIDVVATISDATESASGKLFGRLKGTNP